jgi:very-short-patch-repair endonuclease
MVGEKFHAQVWTLVRLQHGVVSRAQLLALGLHPRSVDHRIAKGRLHPVHRGIFAVGRPELTQKGRWMAAILSCGPDAALSHNSAAALWDIRTDYGKTIHVTVPTHLRRRRSGIAVHRQADATFTKRHGIPVTTPADTLIDLASTLNRKQLEAAINEADNHDLINPERLRKAAGQSARRAGAKQLRDTLDRATFALTRSQLERYFLPLARRAGLPKPLTKHHLNGYEVDFFFPDLGLVVETDSLRYHRTPTQQATDRRRDQAHTKAGLTPLRFTHHQIRHEPRDVHTTLVAVVPRLAAVRAA